MESQSNSMLKFHHKSYKLSNPFVLCPNIKMLLSILFHSNQFLNLYLSFIIKESAKQVGVLQLDSKVIVLYIIYV